MTTTETKPKKKLDSLVFNSYLRGGKLEASRKFIAFQLALYQDCPVKIIIERIKSRKTLQQLGYFFGGVLPPIAEHTGYTINQLYYEVFKPLYAPIVIRKWKGREIMSRKGLSEMSVGEAAEFIMVIKQEAEEMGIHIGTPEDYWKSQVLDI